MGLATNKVELDFGVGDEVKILSGPFAGKVGKVDSIDEDKETGVVLVEFLGNLTPVDTDLVAMEKVDL